MRTPAWPDAGRIDALLGAGFAVAWLVEALIRDGGEPARLALDLPGVVLLLCLAVRRRRPLLAMAVLALGSTASSLLGWALGMPAGDVVVPILALLVAVYSLGAHASRWALAVGAPLALLPMIVSDLTSGGRTSNTLGQGLAFFGVFVVVLPALAGRLVRGRARLVARLREQERLLLAQRATATEAALAEERMQLTGHLHEELLSGMQLLADDVRAARSAATPERVALIRRIEDRARALLSETRGVVVTLAAGTAEPRSETTPEPPSPARERSGAGALPWTAIASAAMSVGLMLEVRDLPVRVPMPVALLGCLLLGAPLALAWRRPLVSTTAVWAAAVLFDSVVVPLDGRFTAIGLAFLPPFFVAAFSGRRGALAGLAVCVAGDALVFGRSFLLDGLPLLLLSWIAGAVLAERTRLVGQLRETTARLDAGRAAALRAAVLAERARVARDLHDSAGHRLTVLALHAEAARRRWDADRERAEAALATIERVASEALQELRQGFVSGAPEADPPSLAAVVALVEQARAAGARVALDVDGEASSLAPASGATAYRMVQEALTNALRHAPGAAVTASVRCTGGQVSVEVVNEPADRPPPTRETGGGHGLVGMRQRVESCGGRLCWGARPDGGFVVRADFPAAVVPA